jgi:hypothetical protein
MILDFNLGTSQENLRDSRLLQWLPTISHMNTRRRFDAAACL